MRWSGIVTFLLAMTCLTQLTESSLYTRLKSNYLHRADSTGNSRNYIGSGQWQSGCEIVNRLQRDGTLKKRYHMLLMEIKRLWSLILKFAGAPTKLNTTIQYQSNASKEEYGQKDDDVGNTIYHNEEIGNLMQEFRLRDGLSERAEAVGMPVNAELIRRYMVASQWTNMYHGKSIVSAVEEAVRLRESYSTYLRCDATAVNSDSDRDCAAFYSTRYDTQKRPVIYARPSKFKADREGYLKVIFRVLEGADAVCNHFNSSGFVILLDMKNCTWESLPPMGVVLEIVNILKWIYPARLGALYVANTGWVFGLVWNAVTPLLSKNTLNKIKFLRSGDVQKTLGEAIGEDNLEVEYGGKVPSLVGADCINTL